VSAALYPCLSLQNLEGLRQYFSQFSPEVTADEKLACTRLKTKFNLYVSFHISVTQDVSLINNTGVWPSGCIIAPYYGTIRPDRIFIHSTPEKGAPAAASNSAANPAGDNRANRGSSTST
jgi:hypothetical protein